MIQLPPLTASVCGRLVASISLRWEGGAEGRVLKRVRRVAGVRRVGGGGVGGRVGGVLVWRWVRVGGDGETVHAVAKASQCEVGGDSLQSHNTHSRFEQNSLQKKTRNETQQPKCGSFKHLQWGKKVFGQPPNVEVFPLKKM